MVSRQTPDGVSTSPVRATVPGRGKQRPYERTARLRPRHRQGNGRWRMTYDPEIHHRHSTRLKEYDYTTANAYFVTVCTHGREALLAEIDDGVALVTPAGQRVHDEWGRLPTHFPGLGLDV